MNFLLLSSFNPLDEKHSFIAACSSMLDSGSSAREKIKTVYTEDIKICCERLFWGRGKYIKTSWGAV